MYLSLGCQTFNVRLWMTRPVSRILENSMQVGAIWPIKGNAATFNPGTVDSIYLLITLSYIILLKNIPAWGSL
jgi:hypothetical protein